MEPAEALADLKQISTQIDRAVIARHDGTLEAASLADPTTAGRMASAAADLYRAADQTGSTLERPPLTQLEVATPTGSVFAVRDSERIACAVTGPDPTVGLIFYDLKACLRSIGEEPELEVASLGGDDGEA